MGSSAHNALLQQAAKRAVECNSLCGQQLSAVASLVASELATREEMNVLFDAVDVLTGKEASRGFASASPSDQPMPSGTLSSSSTATGAATTASSMPANMRLNEMVNVSDTAIYIVRSLGML